MKKHLLGYCVAIGIAVAFASVAQAQTIDKNGRCHDASGKFAVQSVCDKIAKPTSCRDKTTKKFASCGTPNSEPVPTKVKKAK